MMASHALVNVLIMALVAVGQSRSELSVRIEPNVRKLLVPEGSSRTFSCIVERHPNNGDKVLWISPYDNNSVKETRHSPSMQRNSDATFTTTQRLTVSNFTEQHAGTFECVVVLDGGKQERASLMVETIIETKPEVTYYFGNDSVLLYCKANLKDAVFQEWRKDNTTLEAGEKYELHDNGSLSIMKLDRDDAGQYMARYTLSNDDNKIYDCVVDYRAGPLVLDMDKSINKDEGESVDIKCEVKGWPHPEVTWLKDDEVLTQEEDKIIFSPHGGVLDAKLTLSNLEYGEEGVYTCRAFSRDFNQTNDKSIRLRVKDKLAWLYPFVGIIAQIVVLVLLIILFEKIKKKNDSHPHAQ